MRGFVGKMQPEKVSITVAKKNFEEMMRCVVEEKKSYAITWYGKVFAHINPRSIESEIIHHEKNSHHR
jgi:hypothetical protein